MEAFAKNLRQRAQDLGLAHAEVARRVGLSESRFGHYISGRNEPDLALLVKIASVLETTPSELLDGFENAVDSAHAALRERLTATAKLLSEDDLRIVIAQTEAILNLRRRSQDLP